MSPRDVSRSFNFRPLLPAASQNLSFLQAPSHRRCNSEPFVVNSLFKDFSFSSGKPRSEHGDKFGTLVQDSLGFNPNTALAAPTLAPRLKLAHSTRQPRPTTEKVDVQYSPEITLGSPRGPTVGHSKTRIGQPVLKLAAVKERMEFLETANERLQQRIESYKTDVEMLSSSVTYFSSECYAGLLTIRDLRVRSRQDAEILSAQEQQLCQLKKFVGLMVEIGLHEPVLARAHGEVLKGGKENFEPALVDAIRAAAARPGSAWGEILSAATANGVPPPPSCVPEAVMPTLVLPSVAFQETKDEASTVDDLLKSLKNGDIPSGRHRSASQRFNRPVNSKSPARNRSTPSRTKLCGKSPKTPTASASSPIRTPFGKFDNNRTPQSVKPFKRSSPFLPSNKPTTCNNPPTRVLSLTTGEGCRAQLFPTGGPNAVSNATDTAISNRDVVHERCPGGIDGALASLQRILDEFSSGSFGSLGTTTEETESADCDSSAEIQVQVRPPTFVHSPRVKPSPCAKSPICVRPRMSCSTAKGGNEIPAASSTRNGKHLVNPSPAKRIKLGSPVSSPLERCHRTFEPRASPSGKQQKKGWR
ncbi:hypothetical protein GGX14DRAFT_437739 [Mycena pura]|uniref:Uncharacterized protein n=1 Tax=Mycena pura TaxID=153505 RepID=A0AAD6YIY6_9AGAR|nr:hypothetical protein GGX14DRAFT_437739 [Mycena pura]